MALVSLEHISKAGTQSQSHHESKEKRGTIMQLPESSCSKCSAETCETSQTAKEKTLGDQGIIGYSVAGTPKNFL